MSAHEFDYDHFADTERPMDTQGWKVGDLCVVPSGSHGTIESFYGASGSTVYAWVGIRDKPLSHAMPYVGHLRRPG